MSPAFHRRPFLRAMLAGVALAAAACRSHRAATAPAPVAKPDILLLTAKVSGEASMTVNGTTTRLLVDTRIPHGAILRTRRDSSLVLVAADGTIVHLNADGELVVDAHTAAPDRPHFDLHHGELVLLTHPLAAKPAAPVVVTIAGGLVQAGPICRIADRLTAGTGGDRVIGLMSVHGTMEFHPKSGPALQIPSGHQAMAILSPPSLPLPPLSAAPMPVAAVAQLSQVAADLATVGVPTPFRARPASPVPSPPPTRKSQ